MEEPPVIYSEAEQLVEIENLAGQFEEVIAETERLHRTLSSYHRLRNFGHTTLTDEQIQILDSHLARIRTEATLYWQQIQNAERFMLQNGNQEDLQRGLEIFHNQLKQDLNNNLTELNETLATIRETISQFDGIQT